MIKAEEWTEVKTPPPYSGWYKVKYTNGEMEAPFVRNGAGKLVWVIPETIIITHWKLK